MVTILDNSTKTYSYMYILSSFQPSKLAFVNDWSFFGSNTLYGEQRTVYAIKYLFDSVLVAGFIVPLVTSVIMLAL